MNLTIEKHKTVSVEEHQDVSTEELTGLDLDVLRRRINFDTSCINTSRVNLLTYEIDKSHPEGQFSALFRIGAEWLDEEQTQSIVVVPKMRNIDFIEMFMQCLSDSEVADKFADIYDIDFDAKPVYAPDLETVLSPLLVVQYLMCVKRIAARGLRKGYVGREENLNKVKGRIDIGRNERLNVMTHHCERVFCRYELFSADTPTNRYLKQALFVAKDMIMRMSDHHSFAPLLALLNYCLSAFQGVSNEGAPKSVTNIKHNKLYRDYTDALRMATLILRRKAVAVDLRQAASSYVPVFRMNMALLFEHFTLAKLRATFNRAVLYQASGHNGRFLPDFLIVHPDATVIADAKYVPKYEDKNVLGGYIQQLSGYARDMKLLRLLKIDCSDEENIPIVPCVILYPTKESVELSAEALFSMKEPDTVKFYKCPIQIPTYK
jgi:5-methylcytosine-specific restriction enzyme subunit McrC